MKRKSPWIIFLLFAALPALQAQERKALRLEEAVQLGLQNSKTLKAQQARIEQALAAQQEAKEKQLPDVSVSSAYLRLTNPSIDMKASNNNGGSGGSSGGSSPKVNQAMYGLLNVGLPIYQGGKLQYGIRSATLLAKAVQLDAISQQDDVIQTTIEAYANLFKARTAVRLMKENLEQARERVREFSNLEKNGLLARNDLLKAELQASNIEASLLDAENNAQIANLNMNLMLGINTATELQLDTSGIERQPDTRPLEDFLGIARKNREDAMATGLRKQAAETAVKTVKTEYLPSVRLTGGYAAIHVPGFITVTNAINLGLGVNYSVSSLWKTKSKVQSAEAKVREWQAVEEQLNDNITLQVSRSYMTVLSYRKKSEVYAKAVEQARENYRITKNKYTNNLVTTADLLEADLAQLQANLSYTLSRADAFVAYHKLLQATGSLHQQYAKQ